MAGALHLLRNFPAGENVRKVYTCSSCGRISTSVRASKLSHCCRKAAEPSVEAIAEIPIPKCEFGTDFIAVVCRGWVVDTLLLADRTSVYDYMSGGAVQAYVNNLQLGYEHRETDIEVKYGNLVSSPFAPSSQPLETVEVVENAQNQGSRFYASISKNAQVSH